MTSIRTLGVRGISRLDLKTRRYGVIYNIVDPPNELGKQLGIIPHGTTTAWGWEFGVAWRYTEREAIQVCEFIQSCYDLSTPGGRERFQMCGPIHTRYERAETAILECAALVSRIHKERLALKQKLKGMSLADRILAVNNIQPAE